VLIRAATVPQSTRAATVTTPGIRNASQALFITPLRGLTLSFHQLETSLSLGPTYEPKKNLSTANAVVAWVILWVADDIDS
jgi:hypothetical protein